MTTNNTMAAKGRRAGIVEGRIRYECGHEQHYRAATAEGYGIVAGLAAGACCDACYERGLRRHPTPEEIAAEERERQRERAEEDAQAWAAYLAEEAAYDRAMPKTKERGKA